MAPDSMKAAIRAMWGGGIRCLAGICPSRGSRPRGWAPARREIGRRPGGEAKRRHAEAVPVLFALRDGQASEIGLRPGVPRSAK